MPTTLVRRLISPLTRSSGFVDQILRQCAVGNVVNNPSGGPSSPPTPHHGTSPERPTRCRRSSEIARVVLGTAMNRVAVFPRVRALRRHGRHVVGRGTAAPVAGLLPPVFYRAYDTTPKCPLRDDLVGNALTTRARQTSRPRSRRRVGARQDLVGHPEQPERPRLRARGSWPAIG